jgi:hypothetical protein
VAFHVQHCLVADVTGFRDEDRDVFVHAERMTS